MNLLTRFLDAARRRFSRRISGARIGVVVQHDTEGDLAALRSLEYRGRLPLVRTRNDGDPASAERVLEFLGAGFPLLVTIPFGKGFGPVGPGLTLQIDDEPDAQSPAVSPEQYGQTFRSTRAAMRRTIPSTIPIVTAGFSPTASVDWMTRALLAGASDADAICFHVHGIETFSERLATVQAAATAAQCLQPLWVTALEPSGWTHADRARDLNYGLRSPLLRAVERVYISELSTDNADLLGLCDHDLSRTPRPAFGVVRGAVRRP